LGGIERKEKPLKEGNLNYAVILAGGRGERFWPLSRTQHPKQLLHITSDKTMLQETIDRIKDFIPIERSLVVTGANIKDPILDNVTYLKEENLLVEPEGKNTCLAIGLAAVHLSKIDPEACMVVLSSDHYIEPKEKLQKVLEVATEVARKGEYLITLGIVPDRAETAYGYIEFSDLFDTVEGIPIYKINRFREKPDRITAQEYYYDRKHFWNSGMFVWRADTFLKALEKYVPDSYQKLLAYSEQIGKKTQEEAVKKLYAESKETSVDCAVLEKANNVLTIKADLNWDDIGSWLALERIKKKDRDNNVILGKATALGTYETTVVNDSKGIITVLGVSDLVIVQTDDIVFVAHKTRVSDVRELIQKFAGNKELEKYL
jgi:mannose-1-phosphate guanylyltransferase